MSVLSPARRPLLPIALFASALACAFGCAQGSTADEETFSAQTQEPTEPPPGASLPGASTGEETAGGASDAGAPGADGGGASTPPTGNETKAAQGDVLISEIMYDCSGTEPLCEWFEIHNLRTSAKSLSGLTLEDSGGRTHVIGAGVVVPAGGYVVLARNRNAATSDGVPAAKIAYAYGDGQGPSSGVLLANSSLGSILLRNGNTKVAEVVYGGWFSATGSSIQLKTLSSTQMNSKGSWCVSGSAWSAGSERGTPGAAHDCP